ncbi:MAG: HAD hydrolase-like protein [Pseudomonadota bacterium]
MNARDLSHAAIIFDLDGTLVDSAPDLTAALNHVLETEGLNSVEPAIVRAYVGHGAKALLIKGLELQGRELPDGDECEALVERFISYYRAHIADRSCLFDGVVPCLDQLEGWGAALTVCTNKLESLAFPVLEALGVKDRFSAILGRDTLVEHKPSGLPLREILRRTGRRTGVMIGDTATDLNAARNAGLPCAIAMFGYGVIDEPLRTKEQRFDHFEALPELILELLAD